MFIIIFELIEESGFFKLGIRFKIIITNVFLKIKASYLIPP